MKKCIVTVITPIIIGSIVAGILIRLKIPDCSIFRLDFVLNAIITCTATFSGFILTSVSILIGLSSSQIMTTIRQNGGLAELRWRYTESLIIGIIVIAFCIISGATTDEANLVTKNWIVSGGGLLTCYTFSITTTGYYLLNIIGKIPIASQINVNNNPSVPSGDFR